MCKDLETIEIVKIDTLTRLYKMLKESRWSFNKRSELEKEVESKLKELVKSF